MLSDNAAEWRNNNHGDELILLMTPRQIRNMLKFREALTLMSCSSGILHELRNHGI